MSTCIVTRKACIEVFWVLFFIFGGRLCNTYYRVPQPPYPDIRLPIHDSRNKINVLRASHRPSCHVHRHSLPPQDQAFRGPLYLTR